MKNFDDVPVVDAIAGIADEQLNAYVDEAERGYTIDGMKRVPNPFFQALYLVPSDLAATVNERARKDNVSADEVIRKALEKYLIPA